MKGFLANVERAAGGLPLRRMPDWLRPIMGWLMPRIGPRGLEFARARRRDEGRRNGPASAPRTRRRRMRNMVPDHVWTLVEPYGISRGADEQRRSAE